MNSHFKNLGGLNGAESGAVNKIKKITYCT